MYYYDTNERKGRVIGAVAAVLYVAVWVVLMLLVNFHFEQSEPGGGILINFGDTEQASGSEIPDGGASASESQVAPQAPDELLTQDHEDAPVVSPAVNRPQNTPADNAQNTATQPTATVQQPQRTSNPALSMPAVNAGRSSSEGTAATGAGNQGVQHGSDAGSHDGTGTGGSGAGFDLAGRSASSLPLPPYNAGDEGTVVVEVIVMPDGTVRNPRRVNNNRDANNAAKRAYNTTTNDSRLVNAALEAAAKARFNRVSGDGEQRGWIIYNFSVR